MLTYEDMTECFLKAAHSLSLVTHPEYWLNTRSLEREFTCTCHADSCEEAEQHSACSISFSWGPLDTALSLEGPTGVCDFFHESENEQDCPHLHTSGVPPLVLDLSYNLALNGRMLSEESLLSLTQMLKLHASEHSQRTIETRPGVSMILHDNQLLPAMLTLQQRVEIPLWHPLGIHGLHDDPATYQPGRHQSQDLTRDEDSEETSADDPHPEEWLPQVMVEVCQDILHVLEALDATISYKPSDL